MTNSEIIANFLKFMYNRFDRDKAIEIFGPNLGLHIWSKYQRKIEAGNTHLGAAAQLFMELDLENSDKLVEYALNHYKR